MRNIFRRGAVSLALVSASIDAAAVTESLRFDFGGGAGTSATSGYKVVSPATLYTAEAGYGLIVTGGPTPVVSAAGENAELSALVGTKPFIFLVDLPEGNYDVTLRLGDPSGNSNTTVKSETRRLHLEQVETRSGEQVERTFTVNVRTPIIDEAGARVMLKERERGLFHWDDKLLLEFNGLRPAVATVTITPRPDALTIYLAGDSTVTDQPGEPWCAWGQMLPRFFEAGVAVANHAESGLSFATFERSRRLEKILSTLRPGDYVFMQFAHNDQKERGEGVGAYTTYAESARRFVRAVREAGGKPVLVTSMYRRRFDAEGRLYDTLDDYPPALRGVAGELEVPLIDLHAMSARLFSALGAEPSKVAFVHFPAGAYGSTEAVKDDTHFSPYGAYELARCVVEGIRTQVPELASRLADDVGLYDPASPGDPDKFLVPASPLREAVRIPDGDGR